MMMETFLAATFSLFLLIFSLTLILLARATTALDHIIDIILLGQC